MHPWEWPKRPWARIHIDHLGPFQGKTILVVVDAYSKWIESVIVPSTSSQYHYRITPHVTTGVSPAELLMGRKLRSQLDLLQPDTTSHVLDKQTTQKLNHDKHTKERSFEVADPVLVYNFSNGPKWLSGTIIEIHGNCNYTIELTDGRIVRRHIDHLRSRVPDLTVEAQEDIPLDLVPTQVEQTTRSHAVPVHRSTRVSRPLDRYTPSSI